MRNRTLSNFLLLISVCLLPHLVFAQPINLPLSRTFGVEPEAFIVAQKLYPSADSLDTLLARSAVYAPHTAMRPFISDTYFNVHTYRQENSGYYTRGFYIAHEKYPGRYTMRSWRWKERLRSHSMFFLDVATDDRPNERFVLEVDPLLGLEFGQDRTRDTGGIAVQNTRGIIGRGTIGKRIAFETSFLENQSGFVRYLKNYCDTFLVVPGQGRWKPFKSGYFDYAMASGYISYSPLVASKPGGVSLNIQAGHGKHFVGDGYRSLLLSDNSFNYPFVRSTLRAGQFQYSLIYASLMNLRPGGDQIPPGTERLFEKKAATFIQLSWKPHRIAEIGFFQGLIWPAADSLNRQHFSFHYFNPVPYSSVPSLGLDSTANLLLGLTWRVDLFRTASLYGQFVMDDFGRTTIDQHNKSGYQIGLKYFNIAQIKHLHLQIEYNRVRPYTYANTSARQSYTHYNQPLAHPLGANFEELVAFLNYRYADLFAELRLSSARQGRPVNGQNHGSDIFESDYYAFGGPGNTVSTMLGGEKATLKYKEIRIGYVVHNPSNLNVYAGFCARSLVVAGSEERLSYIYFGLRSSLFNSYYDF